MKQNQNTIYGSSVEAVMYPFLLLALIWSLFLMEQYYPNEFVHFGILPKSLSGLKGILFSPLIHSPNDISHILNNSLPAAVLFGALVYFYRSLATRVFFISWFFTGFAVWLLAKNTGSYHIGFSGVIYALAAFLFTSGTIRKIRNLQGISLFVVFVYGSMIWGIFPTQERISWEGHLSGLVIGVILAFRYKKEGPQKQKYQFEIEKELGIEPPDLEGIWRENIRLAEEEKLRREAEENHYFNSDLNVLFGERPNIQYEYKPKGQSNPPQDENAPK